MGYAITTKFGSIDEVNMLLNFLVEAKPILDKLEATEDAFFNFNFDTGSDVSIYAPKKEHDYMISMSGTAIPYYAWAVAEWLSFQSTLRDSLNNPYLYYDDDLITLYVKNSTMTNPIPVDGILLDSDGIRCYDEKSFIKSSILKMLNVGPDLSSQRSIMRELNDAWLQYRLNFSYLNNNDTVFGI